MSGTCTITIENGIQAGRSLTLPAGRHSAGSASDNKVVVADPSIAEAHFILDAGPKPVLIAVDADIVLENGKILQPGDTRAVKLPIRFTAGNTNFSLSQSAEARSASRRFRFATPLALVAGVIGFLVFQGIVAKSSDAFQPASLVNLRDINRVKVKTASEQTLEAVAALKARVIASGISSLNISSDAVNMVQIAGDVPEQQQVAWQNIREWFDATYGTRFTVVDRINISAPVAPLNVAAVRFGNEPFVVDQAGQKLFIGSQTTSGWIVDGITETRVTLHKDNQTAAVTF